MTDINLKDFDKNNWDEFVHLRALKDVINQENAVNNEQNQQITQNTNDIATAKQEAEDAKNTAESAENIANEAKTTADGLSDKVDTAQSTAEDAKNTADEAKTSADNAGKIAGAAQNTATQLGSQVSQLDSEVIKKNSTESFIGTNTIETINGSDVTDASDGNNVDIYQYTTNGNIVENFELSCGASTSIDNKSLDHFQFTFKNHIPVLSWQPATLSVTDANNKNVTFTGGANIEGDNGIRINFDSYAESIQQLTAPLMVQLDINIIKM